MDEHTQHFEDRSDDELAVLAQRRRTDPAGARALEILVERYRRQRFALAHRYGGGADADDLAQEAVLALMRAVDTYQPEEGPVGPWIWQWMWGSSLRAAMKIWPCGGVLELDDIDSYVGEPIGDGFEASVEEMVIGAQLGEQARRALQSALRRLPATAYDAVVFPRTATASHRRSATAMLRHPSLRPVVALQQEPTEDCRGERPASSANGRNNLPPPDPRGNWLNRAACRGLAPQLFWGRDLAVRAAAMEVCGSCAVRAECLRDALALPAGGGVRAGTTEKDRRRLKAATAGRGLEHSTSGRTHDDEA